MLRFKEDTLDLRLLRLMLRSDMFACNDLLRSVSWVIDIALTLREDTLA